MIIIEPTCHRVTTTLNQSIWFVRLADSRQSAWSTANLISSCARFPQLPVRLVRLLFRFFAFCFFNLMGILQIDVFASCETICWAFRFGVNCYGLYIHGLFVTNGSIRFFANGGCFKNKAYWNFVLVFRIEWIISFSYFTIIIV